MQPKSKLIKLSEVYFKNIEIYDGSSSNTSTSSSTNNNNNKGDIPIFKI